MGEVTLPPPPLLLLTTRRGEIGIGWDEERWRRDEGSEAEVDPDPEIDTNPDAGDVDSWCWSGDGDIGPWCDSEEEPVRLEDEGE